MQHVTPEEAQQRLLELLQAAVNGESVVIAIDTMHSVRLVPVAKRHGKRQFGSAKGTVRIADDFDAPLEDFAEYMQ
ncbi:MAG TPA: DUF2281 domain-containing protein [Ktedonobacterales bacterium]